MQVFIESFEKVRDPPQENCEAMFHENDESANACGSCEQWATAGVAECFDRPGKLRFAQRAVIIHRNRNCSGMIIFPCDVMSIEKGFALLLPLATYAYPWVTSADQRSRSIFAAVDAFPGLSKPSPANSSSAVIGISVVTHLMVSSKQRVSRYFRMTTHPPSQGGSAHSSQLTMESSRQKHQ